MLNAISIDVEEYFHARNIELAIGRSCWANLESRVEESTKKVLNILDKHQAKGTFFVLGTVARRHKHLVREIASAGHEVASHGFRHHLAYHQSKNAFYRDVSTSKKLLEDITGQAVIGYRAPNFSIRDVNSWAYTSLVKAGYKYDSSLYPVWHPRYNNLGKPISPHVIETEEGPLAELPLAVSEFNILGKSIRFPAAGGAYWRLFPSALTNWALGRMDEEKSKARISYLHPWEVDPGQPKFKELSILNSIRHYRGIESMDKRIGEFLERYKVKTLENIMNELNLEAS